MLLYELLPSVDGCFPLIQILSVARHIDKLVGAYKIMFLDVYREYRIALQQVRTLYMAGPIFVGM